MGAGVAGLTVAAALMLVPTSVLGSVVSTTGIAALISGAAPPLGNTARAVLAVGGGLAAAVVAWAALYLLFGPGGVWARTVATEAQPSVRWADSHPDAPPRRPVGFADLGPPAPPTPPVEQPLPADLDQPLAAYDPEAVPEVPQTPSQPLPPLATPVRTAPPLEAGERIETFDLNHHNRDEAQPTIAELLRRLEEGAARRSTRAE